MNKHEEFIGWHKSTASGNGSGCVEVGYLPDRSRVGIRDTTRRWAGHIATSQAEFAKFLAMAKAGELDL